MDACKNINSNMETCLRISPLINNRNYRTLAYIMNKVSIYGTIIALCCDAIYMYEKAVIRTINTFKYKTKKKISYYINKQYNDETTYFIMQKLYHEKINSSILFHKDDLDKLDITIINESEQDSKRVWMFSIWKFFNCIRIVIIWSI
jgi:hypothetical protein